jgi:predicted nucleic acid-binding protein
MDAFVLDCSTTMAWCFADEATHQTNDLLDSLMGDRRAYAPSIWPLEVTNVLLVGEQRDRISRKDANRFMTLLWDLPVTIDHEMTPSIIQRILDLGRRHKISSYDSSYLELAQRKGLAIAILDKKLKKVARGLDVPCLL